MARIVASLLACALSFSFPAAAQDEGELPAQFTSDRPGFAKSADIAARFRLTTELGVSVAIADESLARLPHLSIRTGLFDWLEARVRGPNAVGEFLDAGAVFGVDDPAVGFKFGGLVHESVSLSTVWEASLPLGSDGFGSEEANFFAEIQLEWRFWGPLSVTPHAIASVLTETDPLSGITSRFVEGGGSLAVDWQIIDVLRVYVQSFVLVSERSDVRVAVGGGIAWLVAPNVQVDASYDMAVTDQGIPPTVAAGTTILW